MCKCSTEQKEYVCGDSMQHRFLEYFVYEGKFYVACVLTTHINNFTPLLMWIA